jgi:hypothetical protein
MQLLVRFFAYDSSHRRHRRGVIRPASSGAVDAGGGGPLGEDGGVGAELVADGDVEVCDEFAGLLDLGAGEGGFAGVAGAVVDLLALFAGDGVDVGME